MQISNALATSMGILISLSASVNFAPSFSSTHPLSSKWLLLQKEGVEMWILIINYSLTVTASNEINAGISKASKVALSGSPVFSS